MGFEQHK